MYKMYYVSQQVQSTVMFMNVSQPGVLDNLPQTQIPMNCQPNVLTTTGQPVSPTVRQYFVTTTDQPLNIQQLVPQQPERINTDNPPEYTAEKNRHVSYVAIETAYNLEKYA